MLKKAISLMAASVIILTSLAGCGGGSTSTGNSSATSAASSTAASGEEPYTVNFVYHAPKEGNQKEVNEAINKLTMKDLNMKVNLMPIGWDTYNTKYPAMLAAGEPVDISFVFSFSRPAFVEAGYIVDASKYTDYTKDIYKVLGDDVKAGYFGDELLGFPVVGTRAAPSGIFVRKDIFDALGYKESDFNVNTSDVSSFDKLTELFSKIKAKYPDVVPFDGNRIFGQNFISYVDGFGDSFGVLENYGQTTKFTNWYESSQFKKFAQLSREWYTKGYMSKDIAVSKEDGRTKMSTGKSASFFASYVANQAASIKQQTGYDTVLIPCSEKLKDTTQVNAVLNSVMYQSKNKENAFKFLNWAYTNADFNNYLNWGVPDKDWVVNSDGLADYPQGITSKNVNYHEDFSFIYPNQYLMTPWAGNPKDLWEQYKKFDEGAIVSKAYGLNILSSDFSGEIGQCNAVLAKYESAICFGAVDPEIELPKFNKELYKAGLQKVIDGKQKQLDAWLANNK